MDVNARPSLVLYHANGKGTGSAMKMELYPARVGDLDGGAIYTTIARQVSLGDRASNPTVYPRFDWDNAIKVRLGFTDLAKVLQVLLGETESIDDGKGLFHRYVDKRQTIKFRHVIEQVCGYSMEVHEAFANADGHIVESVTCIFLSPAEALGINMAIQHSLAAIAFGVPFI